MSNLDNLHFLLDPSDDITDIVLDTDQSGGQIVSYGDFTIDMTPNLLSGSIRRGRQHELDQIQVGSMNAVIDNTSGDFSPGNTSGAHYPDIDIVKWIRFVWHEGTLPIPTGSFLGEMFWGHTISWQDSYVLGDNVAFSRIAAADSFRFFGQQRITATYSSELSGTRVDNVLAEMGYVRKDTDSGIVLIAASDLIEESALSHLREVEVSEGGLIYVDGRGFFTFVDKTGLQTDAVYTTPQATFGDAVSEIPYAEIEYAYDDAQLFNTVYGNRVGGVRQSSTNAASIAAYGERSLVLPQMHLTADPDVQGRIDFWLNRYKDPYNRVQRIVINAQRLSAAELTTVLGLELHYLVTIKRQPPWGGTLDDDYHVEGIEHSFDWASQTWTITLSVVLAQISQVWILGTHALGSTARLGY